MRNILKYIIGLVIIVGVLWTVVSRILNGNVLSKKNNVAQIVKLDNTPAKITVDKNGNTHAEKQVIYVTDTQRDLYLHKEIDSLKAAIGVKDNQIAGLTTLNSRYRYELSYKVDTTTKPGEEKRYIIDQRGRWFSARGVIPSPNPIIIEGSDSSTVAFIRKGNKLFANVSSANPDLKYYGLRSFAVPEQSKTGFGAGAKIINRDFNYQSSGVSAGLKLMHIGETWMYDVGAGGVIFINGQAQPYVSFGLYKKF